MTNVFDTPHNAAITLPEDIGWEARLAASIMPASEGGHSHTGQDPINSEKGLNSGEKRTLAACRIDRLVY